MLYKLIDKFIYMAIWAPQNSALGPENRRAVTGARALVKLKRQYRVSELKVILFHNYHYVVKWTRIDNRLFKTEG